MSMLTYNRQGLQITESEWARLFSDKTYQRVRVSSVGVSGDRVTVSTVWLGMDHAYGDAAPLIFETMVFGGSLDQNCERYTTEAEAIAGHAAMCAKVRAS